MLDKRIIKYLEEKTGSLIKSSSDCERLALDIETTTGERLGATTLKRLLGFTSENAEPRQSTLEILASYLGFNSYNELKDTIANQGDSEFDNNTLSIYSDQLYPEEEIVFSYYPDRKLKLMHVKDDEFVVKESVNSSLQKGDRIFVDSFTSGLPMISKNVIRDGKSLGRYKAGEKFGINLS